MSSVRSLANLFCSHCNEITLHRANQCISCETVSQSSGNPPVPRARADFNTLRGEKFDAAIYEAGEARRRARRARHQVLSTRGRT